MRASEAIAREIIAASATLERLWDSTVPSGDKKDRLLRHAQPLRSGQGKGSRAPALPVSTKGEMQ